MNVNIYSKLPCDFNHSGFLSLKNGTVALNAATVDVFKIFSLHSSITCVHVHLMCVKLTETSNFLKDKYKLCVRWMDIARSISYRRISSLFHFVRQKTKLNVCDYFRLARRIEPKPGEAWFMQIWVAGGSTHDIRRARSDFLVAVLIEVSWGGAALVVFDCAN